MGEGVQTIPGSQSTLKNFNLFLVLTLHGECATYPWASLSLESAPPIPGPQPTKGVFNLVLTLFGECPTYSWSSFYMENIQPIPGLHCTWGSVQPIHGTQSTWGVSNLFLVLILQGECENYSCSSLYMGSVQSVPGSHLTWRSPHLFLIFSQLGEYLTYSRSSLYMWSVQSTLVLTLHRRHPTYSSSSAL